MRNSNKFKYVILYYSIRNSSWNPSLGNLVNKIGLVGSAAFDQKVLRFLLGSGGVLDSQQSTFKS